jgi:hypothetical protein
MGKNVFDYKGPSVIKLTPEYKEPTSWTGVVIQIGIGVIAFFILCDAFSPMLAAGGIHNVPGMLLDSIWEGIKSVFPHW